MENRLFRDIFISSPMGIYITQDGKFQFVNPELQKSTGYSEDEMIGMDSMSLVHPEYRNIVRENTLKILKGERLSPYEFCVIKKNGDIRWIMGTVTSIQYRGRKAVLGQFMDVTEWKQTDDKLRRLYQAVEATADAVIITDFEGYIQSVNPAFTSITGYTEEEAIGQNPRLLKSGNGVKSALDSPSFFGRLLAVPPLSSGSVYVNDINH